MRLRSLLWVCALIVLAGTAWSGETLHVPILYPDLSVYKSPAWNNYAIVSNRIHATASDGIYTDQGPLYLSVCIANLGNVALGPGWHFAVYIDGDAIGMATVDLTLGAMSYDYLSDIPIGRLRSGKHKITVWLDVLGEVPVDPDTSNNLLNISLNVEARSAAQDWALYE